MPYEYKYYVDTQRDGTFSNGLDDISEFVESVQLFGGTQEQYGSVAGRSALTLVINNKDGRFSQIDTDADYYGLLRVSMLVKMVMRHNNTDTTMAVLRINRVRPIANVAYGEDFQYRVECSDPIEGFLQKPARVTLQEDVRVDQALTTLFNENPFIYPYESAYFFIGTDEIGGTKEIFDFSTAGLTNFEEAYSTLSYVGDNQDRGRGTNARQYITDLMATEFTGLFFWDMRNEQFRFLNRYHSKIASVNPYSARTSSYTFKPEHIENVTRNTHPVVNTLTVNYSPRTVGAAGSVVADKTSVPVLIRAEETKEFTLRYFDPDNDGARVGAKDTILPLRGTDFTGSSDRDGLENTDWTDFLFVETFQPTADSAKVYIYCRKIGEPMYIQKLQIRGTPIISYRPEEITVRNADSVYLYDTQERTDKVVLLDTIDKAKQYGQFWTNLYRDDTYYLTSVTLVISDNTSDQLKQQAISRTIGDVITVEDTFTGTKDYMIIGEAHTPNISAGVHRVTYSLRPTATYTPFIIDESEIGSSDLILI